MSVVMFSHFATQSLSSMTSVHHRISDGDNDVDSVALTVSVTNVNEPPTFTEITKTVNVHSGRAPPQSVTTMAATDVDNGDTITYAISSN